MLNLGAHLKKLEKLSVDNSPVILTVIGVAGVVGTAYLAAKAAVRGTRLLYDIEQEQCFFDMSFKDKARHTYKFYIPAVVTGGLTCAAVVSANRIGTRRTAALAAAYTITEQAFSEYRDKVVTTIGDRKEQSIRDEIAQDRISRAGDSTIFVGDGKVLCYDNYTGRYFQSSMEEIKRAENLINHKMITGGEYASLSDFYEQIGLPPTNVSEEVGWTVDRLLNVEISATVTEEGKPCLVLDFSSVPIRGYHKVHR